VFDFSAHLNFVCGDRRYCDSRSLYTATDALLSLEAQTVKRQERENEQSETSRQQIESFPVLAGLRKYALSEKREHTLLAGRPGSGKSTTLKQILIEMAEVALTDNTQPIPVLVQLKSDRPLLEIICAEFRRAKLKVTADQIDNWLLEDKLVLLLDGVNEIPSDELRQKLQEFRDDNLTTPMIFTTRDLAIGGDLGIKMRLEMRPLTRPQMREFVQKYLPEHWEMLLRQLKDHLRELAETPLLLKMLCDVFDPDTQQIPQSKGELFQLFAQKYDNWKKREGVRTSEKFWKWNMELLQHLAFVMIQRDDSTKSPYEIYENDAVKLIEKYLTGRVANPGDKARDWLSDLVDYHLLQESANPNKIEFHYQLLQEYYAAEALLVMLRDKHPDVMDDQRLQYFYLNYLKWTEPISIALSLIEDEAIAVGMVRSALEVDLILGARLAGEVYPKYSIQTTEIVLQKQGSVAPENPDWLKLKLLKKIGSKAIANYLIPFLNHPSHTIRSHTYLTLLQEAPEAIPETSQAREESNWIRQIIEDNSERLETEKAPPLDSETVMELVSEVRFIYENWISETLNCDEVIAKLVPMLQMPDSKTQLSAVQVIGSLKVEGGVSPLLQAIEDPQSSVCCSAAVMLGKIGFKSAIPKLTQIVNQHPNPSRRYWAVYALRTIGSEEVIPGILQAMQDSDVSVCRAAVKASEKFDSEETALGLLAIISHPDAQTRRLAAYNLRLLSVKENIAKLLNEQHLQTLVQALDQSDEWVRWRIIFTLWNIASEEVIPLLRPKLNHQNCIVGRSAALVLGKFGCKEAVLGLIQMMDYSNLMECPDAYEIPYTAAYALGQIKGDGAAEHLPTLINLLSTQSGQDALRAIAVIQANCQFYNYTIAQWKLAPHTTERSATTTQYNIEHVGIFNAGDVTNQGNQKGETFNL